MASLEDSIRALAIRTANEFDARDTTIQGKAEKDFSNVVAATGRAALSAMARDFSDAAGALAITGGGTGATTAAGARAAISAAARDFSDVTGTLAITNGGTGATTAAAARTALSALARDFSDVTGTLAVANGGTGATTAAAARTALSALARDFSDVTGTLAIANGGTGATTAAAARTALSVYSQAEVDAAVAAKVSKAGDTMTGRLTLHSAHVSTTTVASTDLDFTKDFLVVAVSANTTFTASNIPNVADTATPVAVEITVSSSATITFPAAFEFVDGTAPTLTNGKWLLSGYARGGVVTITAALGPLS